MSNYKGRPKQPRCDCCGKALYKRMDAGPVKPSDPYAYCRNVACDRHGDIRTPPVATGPQAAEPDGRKKSPRSATKKKSRKATAKPPVKETVAAEAPPPAEAPVQTPVQAPKPLCAKCGCAVCECLPVEPEVVQEARQRIRKAIAGAGRYSTNVIGLALSIVAQEMGSHEVANELINEFQLTKRFGIVPVSN